MISCSCSYGDIWTTGSPVLGSWHSGVNFGLSSLTVYSELTFKERFRIMWCEIVSIHPSTYLLSIPVIHQFREEAGPEPSWFQTGGGVTPCACRQSIPGLYVETNNHSHSHSHLGVSNLEERADFIRMFLVYGRKLEHPEKTPAADTESYFSKEAKTSSSQEKQALTYDIILRSPAHAYHISVLGFQS